MPSIEIVSFEREKLVDISKNKYPFFIRQNSRLKSHRGLFEDFLNRNKGIILHLGNLSCRGKRFFFGSDLVDWDFEGVDLVIPLIDSVNCNNGEGWNTSYSQSKRFKFKDSYIASVDDILRYAKDISPIKTVCLLTDYQFGARFGNIINLKTIDNLWVIHNSKGLAWNTLYLICEEK